MIQKPKLGGVAATDTVRRTNISAPVVTGNDDVQSIAKSINTLIKGASFINKKEQVEQNEEDMLFAKNNVIATSSQIQQAINSGDSERDDFNEAVATFREQDLTDTEINERLYNAEYERVGNEIGNGEVGIGTKAYLSLLATNQAKTSLEYSKKDKVKIQREMQNEIYSSADVLLPNETFQNNFNNSIKIAKEYNMTEEDVAKLYINRAYDLASKGDASLLDSLDNIKSKGISIIDTIEGSALDSKLRIALENKKSNDMVRRKQAKEEAQLDNTTKLYTSYVTKNADEFTTKKNVDSALERGDISLAQHAKLTKFMENTEVSSSAYSKESDVKAYTYLRGKAQLGFLSMEELQHYAPFLKEEDYKSLANLGISEGGINGIGSERGKALKERIAIDSKAIGSLDIIENVEATIEDIGIAREKTGFSKMRLNEELNHFIAENKRNPTNEEYDKYIFNKVEKEADKRYVVGLQNDGLSSKKEIVAPQKSIDEVEKTYFNIKDRDEKMKYIKGLNSQEREYLKQKVLERESIKQNTRKSLNKKNKE